MSTQYELPIAVTKLLKNEADPTPYNYRDLLDICFQNLQNYKVSEMQDFESLREKFNSLEVMPTSIVINTAEKELVMRALENMDGKWLVASPEIVKFYEDLQNLLVVVDTDSQAATTEFVASEPTPASPSETAETPTNPYV